MIGVIGMDLNLAQIKSYIEGFEIGKNGGVALLDNDYIPVTNSHLSNLITQDFSDMIKKAESVANNLDSEEQINSIPKIYSQRFDKDNNFLISCRHLRNGMKLIFFTPKDRIFNIRSY